MDRARSVLVVSRDRRRQSDVEGWLRSIGYDVTTASDFDTARRYIDTAPPDILVTDVKLGAYNGLHLAIWLRGRGLKSKAILIGEVDPVLQEEAARTQATYVAVPLDPTSFSSLVASLGSPYSPARRSLRKRVSVGAMVDGLLASIVDMSYEGLRLEVPHAGAFTLPAFLTISIPEFDMSYRVKRVWLKRPTDPSGSLWCGATLPGTDETRSAEWRQMVDRISNWLALQPESASSSS